jgi:hypothetical protein
MFLSDSRVKFLQDGLEQGTGSPMACCLVYYGKHELKFNEIFSNLGYTINLNNK